jgi:hypothetical protein
MAVRARAWVAHADRAGCRREASPAVATSLRPRSLAEVAKEAAVRDREMSRFEAQHSDLAERV